MYAIDALTKEETAFIDAREMETDDYVALRLAPAQGMQMAPLPTGAHVIIQPVLLPKGTLTWQTPASLTGPDGKPLLGLEDGDILSVELRLVVRKTTLCQTPGSEPAKVDPPVDIKSLLEL